MDPTNSSSKGTSSSPPTQLSPEILQALEDLAQAMAKASLMTISLDMQHTVAARIQEVSEKDQTGFPLTGAPFTGTQIQERSSLPPHTRWTNG